MMTIMNFRSMLGALIHAGGYGLAHASLTWTQRGIEANIGVRNLLDRAYPELVAGEVVSPGQPRTVFVSLRGRR